MNIPANDIAIDYMINAPCNLKCPFCYGPDPKMRGELSLEEKYELAKGLKENGISRIVIAGGEPLLCRDLADFIKFSTGYGLRIGIQTNAFFEKRLKNILPDLDWVAFPFDGISMNAQMKMRTSDEHFSWFKNAIQVTTSYHNRNDTHLPKIKVGTVLSKYNIDELEEMGAILSEYKIDVWKLYKVRKRGKGEEIFDEYHVADSIVEEKLLQLREQSPTLNIYYSTDKAITDSYVIIDPDSSTYVIKGPVQKKFGKLITSSGYFDTDLWREIAHYTDFNAMTKNIVKTFPNWNPK